MKVVRTFHPIGQGAFYSERYYDDDKPGARHNIVFDCGVIAGVVKARKVVSQSFTGNDVIDYLFLSHLDYDHVSLVEKLFSSVKRVNRIVLPLVSDEDLVIAISMHKVAGHSSVARFFQRILNHLRGDSMDDDYFQGDYVVEFVGNHNINNCANVWKSGSLRQLPLCNDWVLIPYNYEYSSRKTLFILELGKLIGNQAFESALQSLGYLQIQSGESLYNMLKDEAFVGKILKDSSLRKAFKNVYEKIEGGINANSLVLYSGPAEKCKRFRLIRQFPCCHRFFPDSFHPGCLYTGDADADFKNWKSVFSSVWGHVGTIQVPHHGSLTSFDIEANPIDKQYIMPVSCGTCNTFGHPSGMVLAYLLTQACFPHIVTESANTVLVQVIEGRVL